MDNQSNFPQMLRDYRKENGLSRRELADRLGVSYQLIVSYELGKCKPSPLNRSKLASEMKRDISEIPQGKSGAWFEKTPLNDEEQEFAEQNYNLVLKFLFFKKYPFEEWYDIVVFGYLHAVQVWFNRPDLHKYKFATIAEKHMLSAVSHERRKQKSQPIMVSIYDNIPGTEIPYEAMLCDPRDNIHTDF